MLPIANLREPFNRVAMPSLSRLQHEPMQYRSYYTKFISLLAFVSMPFVVYTFICSDNIIRLVLGQQWIGASEIFKILALAAMIQPVAGTRGVVLLSTGKTRKYLRWGAVNTVATALSVVFGLPWGAKGVASGYTIVNYLILYPSLVYVFEGSPVRVKDFFTAIYKPFTASLSLGTVCSLLHHAMNGAADVIVLSVCFAVGLIVYLAASIVLSGGARDLREYYAYGRIAFARMSA
jgi:O-antigen/teichoic acid export membrane protein